MKARWSYSFSNLGPKKQISETTFYKVAIGKETRWLSMEGIKMLAKAKEAGVTQKMVMKQVSNFTGRGTKVRVTRMRGNIMANLRDLMGTEDMDRVKKGIAKMTDLGGLESLSNEMEATLNLMNEAELRYFWKHNRNLMEKFFTDSDKLKGTPPTASETSDWLIQANIRVNAQKILNKMTEILSRRGTPQQIR